ncbi:MAG TPA: hypothetical protein VKB49_02325 [Candidatus Sulfotelmatobacter sp.]|nr:hypothetical protein [Candidatus Sulfotelmatobacter sp.]
MHRLGPKYSFSEFDEVRFRFHFDSSPKKPFGDKRVMIETQSQRSFGIELSSEYMMVFKHAAILLEEFFRNRAQ